MSQKIIKLGDFHIEIDFNENTGCLDFSIKKEPIDKVPYWTLVQIDPDNLGVTTNNLNMQPMPLTITDEMFDRDIEPRLEDDTAGYLVKGSTIKWLIEREANKPRPMVRV